MLKQYNQTKNAGVNLLRNTGVSLLRNSGVNLKRNAGVSLDGISNRFELGHFSCNTTILLETAILETFDFRRNS